MQKICIYLFDQLNPNDIILLFVFEIDEWIFQVATITQNKIYNSS